MKVAALQMVSRPELQANLDDAGRLIAQAAAEGAKLALLPEYFCLLGRRDDDKLVIAESAGEGPIQAFLAAMAREHRLWLVGGTLPLRVAGQPRVRNSCLVFAPDGTLAARYDKIHLFAYDNGRERYDEARVLEAGSERVSVQAGELRVGLSVCYDLRFPEHYRALMNPPCDLLCVPSAFTYTTGAAHWELLLRARAVENQCYVLAAAQGGRHDNGRRTFGHSLLADPWGQVVAMQPEGPGVIAGDVDVARIAEVRTQLPALAHRR